MTTRIVTLLVHPAWALLVVVWSLLCSAAQCGEITIGLVTQRDGKLVSLEGAHEIRRSPYSGWVVVTWPFNTRVGNTPILDYRSDLLDRAWGAEPREGAAEGLDAAEKLLKELGVEGPPVVPGISRPSVAEVELHEGKHTLTPGDIRFVLERGRLSSDDPRVTVHADRSLLELTCWPVTLRAFDGERSFAAPMTLTYEGSDLLGGVLKPVEDAEKQKREKIGGEASDGPRFRRITLYLAPTADVKPYRFNGVPFSLDARGKVTLVEAGQVELVGDAELHLKLPPAPPTRLVGTRRLDARTVMAVVGHPHLPLCPKGSAMFPVAAPPGQATIPIAFPVEKGKAHLVSLPSTFDALPHKVVMFDAASGAGYLFETGQFIAPPGAQYRCRLMPIGRGAKPPMELDCRLVPLYRRKGAVPATLRAAGDGAFSCELPAAVDAGLWQLVFAGKGPLDECALALLLVTDRKSPATISLYTCRNRAGFVRGEQVDIYWTVRTPGEAKPVGEFEVVLRGTRFERVVAREGETREPLLTGHTRLDTSALAPGLYHLSVRPDTIISYPAHFFVYPREPVSDFGLNSYAPFGETRMDAGSPITTYYSQGTGADEPGLEPATDHARSGLDAALASFSSCPAGPALEKFIRPSEDEIGLMTLARCGKRSVLQMPVMLHHEEWNPKHTLPEELSRLRRRNALFTQKHADLAAFAGITLNWYATTHGYWEESKPLDGHQARRNQEAGKWVAQRATERAEAEGQKNPDPKHLDSIRKQAEYDAWSLVLPTAYGQHLADANAVRPDLTSHTGIPSFWLGGRASYPPLAYSTVTHRDSVDYTDYGRPPWSHFRAPAFLHLHNPQRQPAQMVTATIGRHARILTAFGAAGRGLDGFAFPADWDALSGDHEQLLRIFQRLGAYFRALGPLPDVAVYFSKTAAWPQQKSVILHDLARLRRPGMLLGEEDVLRGELDRYKVLFLAAVGDQETAAVRDAFTKFEKRGGYVIKDRLVAESYPGVDLGFAYDKDQVHNGWGLAWPNGEWEFAHLWTNFLKHREPHLLKAFEKAPALPVTTSDREILISPLAGKESICCFVVNETYVPMSVEGKWRQHAALPRRGDLIVDKGWHVRDLLSGKPCKLVEKGGRNAVELDFTRLEGGIFLLTRREPKTMKLRTSRTSMELQVAAWLEDAAGASLPDPMPFEVTLGGPGLGIVFHKYAALSPERSLAVPLPEVSEETELKLAIRDLVMGCSAEQVIKLSPAGAVPPSGDSPDIIGRKQIAEFLRRPGRVLVLLDEGQKRYRPAAEAMAALLAKHGRKASVKVLDTAEVRELPLRWQPTKEDQELLSKVSGGEAIAWRVPLSFWGRKFDDPLCGYDEYGPRTWVGGDTVLFGGPKDNRALEDLDRFLRRRPSESFPSPGRFFLHYVWDAFQGGCDALYVGCNDPAGAQAAIRCLAALREEPGEAPKPAAGPAVVTQGGPPGAPEDMIKGRLGASIKDVACSPSGRRIFLTLDSYGDSFFVLDEEGKILHARPVANRLGNGVFFQGSGALRPVSDERTFLRLWSDDYLLDLGKGFVERTKSPPHGLPGRVRVPPGGPVLHQDPERGRTYLGGKCSLMALDADGKPLWRHNDAGHRTSTQDMLHRRSIFIRGVSPDGKRLLATAFGVAQDVYGIGTPQNQSVFCIATDSGKVLWAKEGLYLNQGKAILADDRFVIVDDSGQFHLLNADTGEPAGSFRAVGGTDVILPIPKSDLLLVVENNQFDRHGPSSRAYLRAPGERPDTVLDLPGRIRDARIAPDGRRIVLSSRRGQTACFGLDGAKQWEAQVPMGGVVRFSPDAKTTLIGSDVGELSFIETDTGKVLREVDLNPHNLTSPEQFATQMGNVGDVPVARAARVPPEPPEPSYLDSLDKKAVRFGPNLLGKEVLLGKLKAAVAPEGAPATPRYVATLAGPAGFKLKVAPRSTYLVEFLNASADAGQLTPQTRIEVTLRGASESKHLPFTARLPVGASFARRRMAFRTERETEVTLSLRVVVPSEKAEGNRRQKTYEPSEPSRMPMLIGDTAVVALGFQSRNLLKARPLDAKALDLRTEPPARGWIECELHRWGGGDSTFKKWSWNAPRRALGLVDGLIGNQETKWQEAQDAVTGTSISHATAKVAFKRAETISAIAIFEDNRGPVPSGDAVQEMTSMHYGVYINGRRIGYVVGNTNLANVFTFPPIETKTIEYFWAGREFAERTDGTTRMAEFEAYSTEDAELRLDESADITEDGLKLER
jgi:outer membrane protein assembly factor BamB